MKKKPSKPKIAVRIKKPLRDRDLPVTKRLLDLKVQEVKGDVASLRLEMKAGFTKVDARFSEIDARFAEVKAQISSMQTQMTKMMVLLEEQNDRNRVALDGYATVYERFDDVDERLNKLEEKTFGSKQR